MLLDKTLVDAGFWPKCIQEEQDYKGNKEAQRVKRKRLRIINADGI